MLGVASSWTAFLAYFWLSFLRFGLCFSSQCLIFYMLSSVSRKQSNAETALWGSSGTCALQELLRKTNNKRTLIPNSSSNVVSQHNICFEGSSSTSSSRITRPSQGVGKNNQVTLRGGALVGGLRGPSFGLKDGLRGFWTAPRETLSWSPPGKGRMRQFQKNHTIPPE